MTADARLPLGRRVLVADDEPLARERLRHLLSARARYTEVVEAATGAEAIDAILEHRPDIVLLDVQMPELTGLEVAEALGERAPAVIFVTAYEEFARRAFDVSAVDYLLKPISGQQLMRALARAEMRLAQRFDDTVGDRWRSVLTSAGGGAVYASRILVRGRENLFFVRTGDVQWVDAQGNYVRIHVDGRAYMLRETMRSFGAKLDPETFIRIHRSAIINIEHVSRFVPYQHGEYTVTMRDGARLTTSRAYGARLRELLR